MVTPNLFRQALAYELYDRDTPREKRNEERLLCRLTADKVVDTWPPFMPLPTTRPQIKKIAVLAVTKTYRPEDLAAIVAPVRI